MILEPGDIVDVVVPTIAAGGGGPNAAGDASSDSTESYGYFYNRTHGISRAEFYYALLTPTSTLTTDSVRTAYDGGAYVDTILSGQSYTDSRQEFTLVINGKSASVVGDSERTISGAATTVTNQPKYDFHVAIGAAFSANPDDAGKAANAIVDIFDGVATTGVPSCEVQVDEVTRQYETTQWALRATVIALAVVIVGLSFYIYRSHHAHVKPHHVRAIRRARRERELEEATFGRYDHMPSEHDIGEHHDAMYHRHDGLSEHRSYAGSVGSGYREGSAMMEPSGYADRGLLG
jgi:hypothetical protein